ncbi:MAG: autotransporter outer membrane beta-barrel domain-containing protein, partial [Longimicrobiales bacterium]
GFGSNDWSTQRADPTGLSAGALKTDASGHSTQVGVGLRAPLAVGGTTLEPFARFLWQKSTRGATDEGSATPAALNLSRYDATGNRVTLGLTARSANRSPLSDTLTYQFSAGIGRDNGNLTQATVQASLAGIGMGIVSPDVGRLFGLASFTGTLRLGKQAYAYLGLNGEVRRGKNDIGVNGGLRIAF